MYFTDDSLLPEDQAPLMITAAPYGPTWLPADCTPPEQTLPVTWEEQTQIAVDCCNAGATLLHIHVRDPKTGHISKNLKEYGDQIARLRKALPKMILQVGGSISFAPEPGEETKCMKVNVTAGEQQPGTGMNVRSYPLESRPDGLCVGLQTSS